MNVGVNIKLYDHNISLSEVRDIMQYYNHVHIYFKGVGSPLEFTLDDEDEAVMVRDRILRLCNSSIDIMADDFEKELREVKLGKYCEAG